MLSVPRRVCLLRRWKDRRGANRLRSRNTCLAQLRTLRSATSFMTDDVTYASAQARLAWFERRDRHAEVAETGRTLVFDHGGRTKRATLLLHGLSAGPRQFSAIAAALHERGQNVSFRACRVTATAIASPRRLRR